MKTILSPTSLKYAVGIILGWVVAHLIFSNWAVLKAFSKDLLGMG